MKKISFIIFVSFSLSAFSQVITEEELHLKVQTAQQNCEGAHDSFVQRTNEDFASFIWGKSIRMNEAKIVKFFNHPSGEAASAVFDIYRMNNKNWNCTYDPKAAADLLKKNGVRVTESYNKLVINARQDLILAESEYDGKKTILELYCPDPKFLEVLRIGQSQSIEFLVTSFWSNPDSDTKIFGILTQVNTEKQTLKCSNGHEFDKNTGYKFCPTCGEPLK